MYFWIDCMCYSIFNRLSPSLITVLRMRDFASQKHATSTPQPRRSILSPIYPMIVWDMYLRGPLVQNSLFPSLTASAALDPTGLSLSVIMKSYNPSVFTSISLLASHALTRPGPRGFGSLIPFLLLCTSSATLHIGIGPSIYCILILTTSSACDVGSLE